MIQEFICVCVCMLWNESILSRKHVTVDAVKECVIEREAVICVHGLIAAGYVCWGIITGRPRLRAAASLSFLFDDVPHHKALNTQMRRLRGRVEMGAF